MPSYITWTPSSALDSVANRSHANILLFLLLWFVIFLPWSSLGAVLSRGQPCQTHTHTCRHAVFYIFLAAVLWPSWVMSGGKVGVTHPKHLRRVGLAADSDTAIPQAGSGLWGELLLWEDKAIVIGKLNLNFRWEFFKKEKKESHFQRFSSPSCRWSLLFVQTGRFHSQVQEWAAVLVLIVTHPHELCFSLLNILFKLPGKTLCVSFLDHVSEDRYFTV